MKKLWTVLALCSVVGAVHAQGRSISGASSGGSDSDAGNVIGDTGGKYKLYVGVDYQWLTLSVLNSRAAGGFPQQHYYGRMYDLRLGYRVYKNIGFEVHYGLDGGDDKAADGFGITRYYGVYVVPTATVLNTFELSLPIGYAFTGVKQRVSGQQEYRASINSAAFGANIELPIREFSASLPNIRITGGGVVYVQRSNAQIYGFHAGLRYDFGFGSTAVPEPAADTSSGAFAPGGSAGGGAPAGAAPAGGAPGGGAPAGAAPAGGAPGGGAPAGAAPAGGAPGGGAPAGTAPAGGAPGGGAPAGVAPSGGAPGGGAPPV